MKACVIDKFGGRDRLTLTELPTPEAGEGEVLIRIRAAGVDPVDWKIREGLLKENFPHEFPLILGWELAGVVETVGHSARRFSPGDEVYAYARRPVIQKGTYAEYIALPESYVAAKPASLSLTEAASVPLTGLTAYQALFDNGRLAKGQSVLVMGASGGVGSSAVQLAAERGCRVIGLASGRRHDYVIGLGAQAFVDYTGGDFREQLRAIEPGGVDLVFDCVGGEVLDLGLDCLHPGGRLVSITEAIDTARIGQRDITFGYTFVEPNVPQLNHIADLVAMGRFRTNVTQTYALDEVARAHEQIETGHTRGKIVLEI